MPAAKRKRNARNETLRVEGRGAEPRGKPCPATCASHLPARPASLRVPPPRGRHGRAAASAIPPLLGNKYKDRFISRGPGRAGVRGAAEPYSQPEPAGPFIESLRKANKPRQNQSRLSNHFSKFKNKNWECPEGEVRTPTSAKQLVCVFRESLVSREAGPPESILRRCSPRHVSISPAHN